MLPDLTQQHRETLVTVEQLIERITELENRLEFQDETIASLNDALVAQQRKYFELDRTVKLLITQLKERWDNPADPGAEPPPPHY
jgi:SlyX protein